MRFSTSVILGALLGIAALPPAAGAQGASSAKVRTTPLGTPVAGEHITPAAASGGVFGRFEKAKRAPEPEAAEAAEAADAADVADVADVAGAAGAAEPAHEAPDEAAAEAELVEAPGGVGALPGPAAGAAAALPPWRSGRAFGYSGRIRAAIVSLDEAFLVDDPSSPHLPRWVPMFDGGGPRLLGEPVAVEATPTPSGPGVYLIEYGMDELGTARAMPLAVIATVPFEQKDGGYLNGYHIGRYPVEGSGRTDRYAPPGGFIEVTAENQDFQISEHFRLRHFLTKDQGAIWPKYLALDLRLIDKLELVLQELNAMGVRAEAMHVMSGFRTPQYNGPGGDGRAALSRHTYGDAADVWVDSDGDGYMDDLNGDGRADIQDARVIMRAVERVEQRYPELIGGAGVYVANGAHGPFIHIDVRGSPARW